VINKLNDIRNETRCSKGCLYKKNVFWIFIRSNVVDLVLLYQIIATGCNYSLKVDFKVLLRYIIFK